MCLPPQFRHLAGWFACALFLVAGCQQTSHVFAEREEAAPVPVQHKSSPVQLTAFQEVESDEPADDEADPEADPVANGDQTVPERPRVPQGLDSPEDVESLIASALANNPAIVRLRQQHAAALQKVRYVDKLPDPILGANLFGNPIETAAGSQRANLSLAQRIPWLARLDAQEQRACLEALAITERVRVAELRVVADIKRQLYQVAFLQQRIDINRETEELLTDLVDVATQLISVGRATAGDVLLGTVQIASLTEERIELRQRQRSAQALLNRLLARPSGSPIPIVDAVPANLPAHSRTELIALAMTAQPEIRSAALSDQAAVWGITVAALQRRPDVTVGATWYGIEGNRPPSNVVGVGQNAWSVGVNVSIPLWREKYDAIEQEAIRERLAANATVADVRLKYEGLIADVYERAVAAKETLELYEETLIPQAERTLASDQESYAEGEVEFDRVIEDVLRLLKYQVAVDRQTTHLATLHAELERLTASRLMAVPQGLPEPIEAENLLPADEDASSEPMSEGDGEADKAAGDGGTDLPPIKLPEPVEDTHDQAAGPKLVVPIRYLTPSEARKEREALPEGRWRMPITR